MVDKLENIRSQFLNYIIEAFSFHLNEPLLFTQLFFWIFLLIVLGGYIFVYNLQGEKVKWKVLYLLLVSFYFYYKTSGVFIILLWYVIIADFFIGKKIYESQNASTKKWWLTLSIANSLLLLSYFKYSQFFVESFNQLFHTNFQYVNYFSIFTNACFNTHFDIDKLIFPVGISFFLFQTMSYIIDIYQRKVEPVNSIIDYGFFVCFFPHLVAGPIVKAHDFLYQIRMPYQLTILEFKQAWWLIMKGFTKKTIADYLAIQMIDKIFDNPNYFTSYENFLAIIGYSYQVYADFSGYTDMAIGIALLFGYRLKKNFNYPYKAQSPSEFWQRWHISLSSWLKEYLYIPLGGNRGITWASYIVLLIITLFLTLLYGSWWMFVFIVLILLVLIIWSKYNASVKRAFERDVNIMVTMLLGGLWHGSSWLFVIWGGLNGLAVVVHKQWEKISPFRNTNSIIVKLSLMILTLLFISFTRIFFRSQTLESANKMIYKLFNGWEWKYIGEINWHYKDVLLLLILMYILHWMPEKWREKVFQKIYLLPIWLLVPITCIIVLLMYQLMSAESKPFIYFQF
ncbi:MAG: alginate O-acetyltransferase [Bacteroidia bacterium]|nr:MAG: alginate O-acetyltransferase [Bacteroidia bacterium]